jgi:hypothetical protein
MAKVEYVSEKDNGAWAEYSRPLSVEYALIHKDVLEKAGRHVRVVDQGVVVYETP